MVKRNRDPYRGTRRRRCKVCHRWFRANGTGVVNCPQHRRPITPPSPDDLEEAKKRVTPVACWRCEWGRRQPASTTGWECTRMVAASCKPATMAARYEERTMEAPDL